MSRPELLITNVAVYRAIADEAYQEMVQLVEAGRRPKPDGSAGSIITYDPSQASFKKSMISIVFTGMWLEALMHLLIVRKFGEEKFRDYDFESYEKKLSLFGITDQELICRVTRFHTTRNALVHEKAYDDTKIRTAQSEAENAHKMIHGILAKLPSNE